MRLEGLRALEQVNSSSNYTIKVQAWTKRNKAAATVPGGKSTGAHEVKTVTPADAVKIISDLKLKGENLDNIDKTIACLPGNVSTGISMAVFKLIAKEKKKELYELWKGHTLPVPFMNIINGGLHAGTKLSFQEFLIAPMARTYSESLRMGVEVYNALRNNLKRKYGVHSINMGAEGGFTPQMRRVEEALTMIRKTIEQLGYAEEIGIGIDAAATHFYRDGKYYINAKVYGVKGLTDYYEKLAGDFNLISIEDPFQEEDFHSFAELRQRLKGKTQIVGDDLLVTNPDRVLRAVNEKSCSCLLLKINQVGTVTKALESADIARRDNWNIMVSHRSGDSCDTFITDFAVGINAGQIKCGAPSGGEHVNKYNRLLEIEEKLGTKAVYKKVNL